MGVREWLKNKLRMSARIHLAVSITSLPQAIALTDRFLADRLAYPLEWDDFISWESSRPIVEQMRDEIGQFEPLLFGSRSQRASYVNELRTIRDKYAALI